MRYIGNKENLLEFVDGAFKKHDISGNGFLDAFAGTCRVGMFFRRKGWRVIVSDLMYYSYVIQRASIACAHEPEFFGLEPMPSGQLMDTPLIRALELLDSLRPRRGFIYHNYTPEGTRELPRQRMYLTGENGARIDAARLAIEQWRREGRLTDDEYYVLVAAVVETVPFYANIAGVYAAFQKTWDPRAVRKMRFRAPGIINGPPGEGHFGDTALLLDSVDADVFYLDPPYNQRQYAPNYHLLETIAAYDSPKIKGVSGMRDYSSQKSLFCNAETGIRELERYLSASRWKWFVLSYNNEGIMPHEAIMDAMSKYGSVALEEYEYPRFKSNNNGLSSSQRKNIRERLYILRRSC